MKVPDWILAYWEWFEYGHWSLTHLLSKFWLSILILKVQRTSMSFKSSFGDLEKCWRFLTGVWDLYHDLDMVTSLWFTHVLNFGSLSWLWKCKEHLCPFSHDWGFGGWWRFLIGVWHVENDLDMVIGLWYTYDQNFGSLSWFWTCKEHPCPLSPGFRLWRMLMFLTGVWDIDLDLNMVSGLWYIDTHIFWI